MRLLQVLVLSVLCGGVAIADPPTGPKYFWRNRNDYKHYVLYEKSSNTWVETVNCVPAWRFTKISSDLNNLYLRDAGRKLTVKVNYDGMWLKFDNQTSFSFYQPGAFEKRVRFFHQYNGQWTGTVSRKNGCAWEELLAGGSAPSFHFKAYGEDASSAYLYDGSRNMRVRLNAADMWLQPSGQPTFSFFKTGYWSEY
jgi:hypothetical protein